MAKRGDQFGKWTIVEGIDSGGQGTVYRASGAEGEPEVAVKVVKAVRIKKRARFLQEINAQRTLSDRKAPNVMPLLDSNLDELQDGCVSGYLVMPLAKVSLDEVLPTVKGRPELALEIFAGILKGVEAAHDNGIIHRDLKPANILFMQADLRDPLISDFGICLLKETPEAERLTDDGETVGAKYFMAPEQERGGVSTVTAAADIYSLGKLLHYMVTGRNIYREEVESAFTDKELESDSRYQLILDEVLTRTVVHEAKARIQDVSELAQIVRQLQRGGEPPKDPEQPPPTPVPSAVAPEKGPVDSDYRMFLRAGANASSPDYLLTLDDMRRGFRQTWDRLYETVKDAPQAAPAAARALIVDQTRPLSLALALGRSNATSLFEGFQHFLELTVREDEPRSGYPEVFSVPYPLGGFLYMAAATQALCYQSWDVLRLLLNERFEWSPRSQRSLYSFGFSLSYFFHAESLGREASKIHNLYRELLNETPLRKVMTLTNDELHNTYLQAQLLLCLRVAQEVERGNEARIWPDYGRFYETRVRMVFDRGWAKPGYGDGLASLFGESREDFFQRLNNRLLFIRQNFWSGSNYFWESLGTWEPR